MPRATREYGREAEHLWGVSLRRQLAEQVWLALRFGFDADVYYRYRLYLLGDLRDAVLFIPTPTNVALRHRVRGVLGYDVSIGDKRQFAERCCEEGLPTAPIVAEFDGGDVRWGPSAEGGVERLPARDLFSKPADDLGGAGAARWVWDGAGYVGEDGERLAAADLVAHLQTLSQGQPHVLQPRLVNVPDLDALSPGTLATVRVITAKGPGSDPEHVGSFLRMAMKDQPVDNFDQGGLAAPVDAETGRLGPAIRKDLRFAARDYDRHPTTGHAIVGARVPQWEEVLALALEAHRTLTDVSVVGWDVAVTTSGVVLVEANTAPDARFQQTGLRPLGTTAYARVYLDVLDAG
ncbi:sugar-transfer associated ATP-grasp domain-containing protein [Rubrivirga sp. S365]|uniref:Sugar-transfer associated ATP-grasp domain-containing protein n=1 Tax=Rubrivirga litoralis TaxID=3075598 RepID=A0ABU3BSG9_9BACT|nr:MULTISPECIES: sugar-transfer associated ATP-grasp domain-containing protein [unclassified Rubrivirga]MDT0632224.1 sugar-transfer associated ATP-grasp domain-containing protein [Rubrivirga sp. F394]MDT7856834.1 sugar-transfer associated ATP-grasp domain-containing protein [Rubrivirga sp. S365]